VIEHLAVALDQLHRGLDLEVAELSVVLALERAAVSLREIAPGLELVHLLPVLLLGPDVLLGLAGEPQLLGEREVLIGALVVLLEGPQANFLRVTLPLPPRFAVSLESYG
jgi:hypothetical protein